MATYSAIRSDAWLLLSIIYASRFPPVTLAKILAAGDIIRHALMTQEEIDLGLGRLIEGGMVRRAGEAYFPTELVLITYYLNERRHTSVRQDLGFVNGLLKNEYWLEVVREAARATRAGGSVVGEAAYREAVLDCERHRRGKYRPRGEKDFGTPAREGSADDKETHKLRLGGFLMTNSEVLTALVEAINSHNVESVVKWLSKDHVFVDSLGQTVWGSGGMKTAWGKYFDMVPDYEIVMDEIFEKPGRMVLLGKAKGTFAPDGKLLQANRWETHAAWKVVIKNERVAEWQVFADNEPLRQIIRDRQQAASS